MKILFVVNNYYASGNGLSASARRTVKYLREAGEDVPVFDPLIQSHGYTTTKPQNR